MWSSSLPVQPIHGLQCWLHDAISCITSEAVHICRIEPYVMCDWGHISVEQGLGWIKMKSRGNEEQGAKKNKNERAGIPFDLSDEESMLLWLTKVMKKMKHKACIGKVEFDVKIHKTLIYNYSQPTKNNVCILDCNVANSTCTTHQFFKRSITHLICGTARASRAGQITLLGTWGIPTMVNGQTDGHPCMLRGGPAPRHGTGAIVLWRTVFT